MFGFVTIGIFLAILLSLQPVDADEESDPPPNIVLMMSDDQGWADVSAYPHAEPDVSTPNIDLIAEDGVRLTDAYVSAPLCSPSRAGLMTGRYQERFGSYRHSDSNSGLPIKELTIADLLKPLGYRTGVVGKWHLGFNEPYYPVNRGFDMFLGNLGGFGYTDPELMDGTETRQYKGFLTEIITDRAVKFIKGQEENPFFLYVAYKNPHTRLEPPQNYLDQFQHIEEEQRRKYLAMLAALDKSVGRILDTLKEEGKVENTMVFFLSDNGGAPANGSVSPLRERKGSLFEGGIRVPMLVRWPGRLPAGTVCSEPIISLDILPTCVKAAGGQLPTDRGYDGKNMLPALLGKNEEPLHENLFWAHRPTEHGEEWAIRHGKWKLVHEDGSIHLSNLKKDPKESTNLVDERPELVEQLKARYRVWRELMAPRRGDSPVNYPRSQR